MFTIILNRGKLVLDKSIAEVEKLDTPTTIKFTTQDDLSKIQGKLEIRKVSDNSYEVADIASDEVKNTLSLITGQLDIQHIEVKRSKLEYLLEQTAERRDNFES